MTSLNIHENVPKFKNISGPPVTGKPIILINERWIQMTVGLRDLKW